MYVCYAVCFPFLFCTNESCTNIKRFFSIQFTSLLHFRTCFHFTSFPCKKKYIFDWFMVFFFFVSLLFHFLFICSVALKLEFVWMRLCCFFFSLYLLRVIYFSRFFLFSLVPALFVLFVCYFVFFIFVCLFVCQKAPPFPK